MSLPVDLEHLAAVTLGDPRDVVWWAEVDGGEHRRRDFTPPRR